MNVLGTSESTGNLDFFPVHVHGKNDYRSIEGEDCIRYRYVVAHAEYHTTFNYL